MCRGMTPRACQGILGPWLHEAICGCKLQADRLVLLQSLVGIRAETICLHACACGIHTCVHTACVSTGTGSKPLALLGCLFSCLIHLPPVMSRLGLNPAHLLCASSQQQVE